MFHSKRELKNMNSSSLSSFLGIPLSGKGSESDCSLPHFYLPSNYLEATFSDIEDPRQTDTDKGQEMKSQTATDACDLDRTGPH